MLKSINKLHRGARSPRPTTTTLVGQAAWAKERLRLALGESVPVGRPGPLARTPHFGVFGEQKEAIYRSLYRYLYYSLQLGFLCFILYYTIRPGALMTMAPT